MTIDRMYKIYRIVDNTNDNVYIGLTERTLKVRLREHKNSQNCKSRDIIKNGDYRIELIEETDDKSRERWWIENTDCVNISTPGRTHKEWREDNKDHLANYNKEWHEKHKGHLANYNKEWREDNKGHLANYNKEYREKNIEKIKRRQTEYQKKKNKFFTSMGGRPDRHNMSLLKIDPDLFNQN